MSAVINPPIGADALLGITMTPRVVAVSRDLDVRAVAAYAALEPAGDEQAYVPKVELEFTEDDEAEMRRLSEDLDEAVRLAVAAEQRHTSAHRTAQALPHLLDKSGQLAARAIGGDKAAKAALDANNARIDDARLAESALRTLAEEKAEAARYRDGCYGRLRAHTNKSLVAMRSRAAAEYGRLAEEMRRCLACIDVSIEMQAHDRAVQAISSGWHCVMGVVKVPAMPVEFRGGANGVEHHSAGGDLLIAYGHGYLTFQQKAIRSRLQTQIAESCAAVGLQSHNLL